MSGSDVQLRSGRSHSQYKVAGVSGAETEKGENIVARQSPPPSPAEILPCVMMVVTTHHVPPQSN